MKKIISLIAISMLLVSCGGKDTDDTTTTQETTTSTSEVTNETNVNMEDNVEVAPEEVLSEEELNNILDAFFNSVEE